MMSKELNEKKYIDLIFSCIKYGADDDGKITKTKLAKLLYLSDFAFFAENGRSISNAKYLKLERGPVPLIYFDFLQLLSKNNSIQIEKKGNSELISSIKNNENFSLSKQELELIKKVCNKWKSANTGDIVKFTHKQIPWAVSFENDLIPYELIIQEEHVY